MSKLTHSTDEGMDEIDRRRAIENGFEDLLPSMTAFSHETGRERVTVDMLRAARRKAPSFWTDYASSERHMRDVIEAALSASPVARATMPRGGVETDWYAESIKLYRQNKTLRKALQEQHDWHLAQGEQEIEGVTLNMANEYGDSGMCERTTAALDAVLPSGIAGYEKWKEQKASPVAQEPVAWDDPDLRKRISNLAAKLVVSGYMASQHSLGEATKTAERELLEFACDETRRYLEQRTPPATSAGLGADEIARVFVRWKKSKNLHESLAAQSIEKELLALLSRAGDQGNSTQKDGSR